ncbi:hypothetical protein TKWG_21210 [Advenella kashmirensis WT001]|uniref:Uncharacterized protein n=1 Tax=Advenella kashmirensis (strain DSM 17095 / LMG 22695 / WT001) TaxID=1036672 RepID=I3UG07_ADVKW|nr:hypothetical protein [Advenella kashmirensis]AFK63945.1 hypothetical protein TKWG_21210 [Advenella kashmirensis WT001]
MKSFPIFRIHPLIRSLPFSDELLAEINADSDFLSFLEFYSLPFGYDEFFHFKNYIQERNVTAILEEAPKSESSKIELRLIGAVKHTFAYGRLLTTLAGRGDLNALEIPHLFESEDDLNATFSLLKAHRYKNVDQLLRSVIELAVRHAYFSLENSFSSENHKTKSLSITNDRDGLVTKLISKKLLNNNEGKFIIALYRRLSIAIHSGYRYLTYPEEPVNQNKLFLQSLSNMQDVSLACIYIILNMMRVDLNNNIYRYRERDAFTRSKAKYV